MNNIYEYCFKRYFFKFDKNTWNFHNFIPFLRPKNNIEL